MPDSTAPQAESPLPVTCTIKREVDVYVAISRGRELANAIGFNEIDRTRIEIVILELTRNLLVHAGGGDLRLSHVTDGERTGMAVATVDNGPGIADIDMAMRDGYSTAHTLGAGLPGVKRLMDSFTIESTVGVGTHVRAVKWLPRRNTGGRR
ncbi:MAG: anti-sigma regulatory factor [Chloroflexaceae bacterium]|jgi:anti-sigma regulatory factor (Ser/Thr protein kinase)|nr:anti-sigma regulatory factor [Chloroflexaceae bacterium]